MTEFVYCPHCASRLGRRLRGGIERPACDSCGYVQFRNPVVGVAVVIEAAHQCMTTRGVHNPGSIMVTSRMLGGFRTDASTRREFLSMIANPPTVEVGPAHRVRSPETLDP